MYHQYHPSLAMYHQYHPSLAMYHQYHPSLAMYHQYHPSLAMYHQYHPSLAICIISTILALLFMLDPPIVFDPQYAHYTRHPS